MNYVSQQKVKPDIIVFLDGDYSDYPEELINIVGRIIIDVDDEGILYNKFVATFLTIT